MAPLAERANVRAHGPLPTWQAARMALSGHIEGICNRQSSHYCGIYSKVPKMAKVKWIEKGYAGRAYGSRIAFI